MESTEPDASDVEGGVERLVELLESLATDLGESGEPVTGEVSGGSAAAQENQTIRLARSSLALARAESLLARVDEARRQAQHLLEASRVRQARPRRLADISGRSWGAGDSRALRATMADAARRLNRTRTEARLPEEMLRAIVAGALRAIPHVVGASVTLMDHSGVITTHAPSDELIAQVDRAQTDLREGPCIDALDGAGSGMTHAHDLDANPPWPHFATEALHVGIHEVLCFQLYANGAAGALNLYSDAPHRFDAQDELVGALFADQAAVALAGARRVGQLNKALETRDVIGQAKGILMERFGLDQQQAFEMLVESSQHTNMKLVSVAEWLISQTAATPTARPADVRNVGRP